MKVLNEIIDTIKILNEFYEEQTHDDLFIPFSVTTTGYMTFVSYGEEVVWKDWEDEREFIDDKNDWEPLINYLVRQASEVNALHIDYTGAVK